MTPSHPEVVTNTDAGIGLTRLLAMYISDEESDIVCRRGDTCEWEVFLFIWVHISRIFRGIVGMCNWKHLQYRDLEDEPVDESYVNCN